MAIEEPTTSQIIFESVVKEELMIEDELPPEPHCEDTLISTSGFDQTIKNGGFIHDHDELGKPETVPRPALRCGKCKKIFRRTESYKFHCKKHEEIEGKQFLRKPYYSPMKNALQKHVTSKNYGNRRNYKELEEHETSKHGTIKVDPSEDFETDEKGHLKCNECPKTFVNRIFLLRHLRRRKAVDEGRYQCKICGNCLGSNIDLSKHSLKFHNEDQRALLDPLQMEGSGRFKCSRCPATFARRRLCIVHIRRHTVKDEATYQCKACLKCFSEKVSLNRHEQGAIKNQTKSVCFKNRQQLEPENTDKTYDVIEENGVFKCSDCKKVFPKRKGCVAHIQRHEAIDNGIFKCHTCGKIFSFFAGLKSHALIIHGEKLNEARAPKAVERDENGKFLCSECPRKYATKKTCLQHMRGHENVRNGNYKCEECQMCFERIDKLFTHVSKHKKKKSATSASFNVEGRSNSCD